MKILSNEPERVAKRAFFLAYQASPVVGMGHLQKREGVTEEDVWSEVAHATSPYGDYVFGRMMKVGMNLDPDGIEVRDIEPRADYQGWCHAYPTYKDLIEAAIEDLAKVPA